MAKARLLRQYLADYNRKVQGSNKDYKESYNHYKAAADTYNAHAAPSDPNVFNPNGRRGLDTGEGKIYTGRTADGAWSGMNWNIPGRELSWEEATAIGDRQLAESGGFAIDFGYNPEFLPSSRPEAGRFMGIDYETFSALSQDDPRYAQQLAESQAAWDKEKGIYDAGGLKIYEIGEYGYINDRGDTRGSNPGPGHYATAYRPPGEAPTQDVPKAPTFTNSQLEEMANPSNSAAEINRAQAFGYTGKSALVAERDPSKNSAFANLGGDDPNNLKEKGVLARAIAGEI